MMFYIVQSEEGRYCVLALFLRPRTNYNRAFEASSNCMYSICLKLIFVLEDESLEDFESDKLYSLSMFDFFETA